MSLLPNDFDMALETIVEIYRKRWLIESLFTQIKQNFPLRYFYGESANAIKIQVCATLIGNLLMTLLQRRLTRPWSFSGLATMVRIILMYYINMDTSFERPDEDLKLLLKQTSEEPLEEENLT
ncbi:transposase [Bacteroides heparinolyticus]|uniref:Transposase n=2 Tax=Prevotella heparinolytica TaxID=28113 RepID=A0A449I0D8_9BACE|nr:transposase [Bacteroides heparinolyticus]VFB12874.1 transposase [Bacteroides heparinolyticus]